MCCLVLAYRRVTMQQKQKTVAETYDEDHAYTKGPSRRGKQTSKKLGCKAVIRIQEEICFTGMEVKSQWKRKVTSRLIQDAIKAKTLSNIPYIRRFYVVFPDDEQHQNHLTGCESGFNKRVDRKIIDKIHEMVHSGVRSLDNFAETLQPEATTPDKLNRRLYPLRKDIYNHTQLAKTTNRYSNLEQENVENLLEELLAEGNASVAYFRPHGSEGGEKLLVVIQLEWQKHLLARYGKTFLIDSTFGTTKYDLPLYQVVVQTNTVYQPIAIFVTEDETAESLTEALEIITSTNPDWKPCQIVVDIDAAQSKALSQVFPEASILYCKFHREQAWERWMSRDDNGVRPHKTEALHLLRAISNSISFKEYEQGVTNLKNSKVWGESEKFRKYLSNYWLTMPERWVLTFRSLDESISLTTTNGVERLHRELKKHLGSDGKGSLFCLIKVLIDEFLPETLRRYLQENFTQSSLSRAYSTSLPDFLHNRPRRFIDHCLPRLADATQLTIKESSEGLHGVEGHMASKQLVNTTDDKKLCNCPDFRRHSLPCKHILAVILHSPAGWLCLPYSYRSSAYFNLDEYLPPKKSQNALPPQNKAAVENTGPSLCCEKKYDSLTEIQMESNEIMHHRHKALASIKLLKNCLYQMTSSAKVSIVAEKLNDMVQSTQREIGASKFKRSSEVCGETKEIPLTLKRRKRLSRSNKSSSQHISHNLDTLLEAQMMNPTPVEEPSNVESDGSSGSLPSLTLNLETKMNPTPVEEPSNVESDGSSGSLPSLTLNLETKVDAGSSTFTNMINDGPPNLTPKPASLVKQDKMNPTPVEEPSNVESDGSSGSLPSLTLNLETKVDAGSSTFTNMINDGPPNLTPKPASLVKQDKKSPRIPCIEDIWRHHAESDALMAIVGGNKLFGYSFGSVKDPNWVSDEIVSSYMWLIEQKYKDRRIMSINCHTMTYILNKPRDANLMKKINMREFDLILAPIGECGHWELCVIYPQTNRVLYLNSYGEGKGRFQQLRTSWLSFLNRRYMEGLEPNCPFKTWRFETMDHVKQIDGRNCAIFIMKFADLLAGGATELYFANDRQSFIQYRKSICKELLQNTDTSVGENCRHCGLTSISDECIRWVQCDCCWWWYHCKCVDPTGHILTKARLKETFVCDVCVLPFDGDLGPHIKTTSTPLKKKANKPDFPLSPISQIQLPQKSDTETTIRDKPTGSLVVTVLNNRIKRCNGCNNLFKKPPTAPNNLVLKHWERYTFYNKYTQSEMTKWGNKFYHMSAHCVRAKLKNYRNEDICIPPDVTVTDEHVNHYEQFGVSLGSILNVTLR